MRTWRSRTNCPFVFMCAIRKQRLQCLCEIFLPTVTQVLRSKTLQPLEFQLLFAICKYKDKTVHCIRVAGTPASYRRPPHLRHVSWPKLAKRTVASRTLISEERNVTNWGFVPGHPIDPTKIPNDNKNKLKHKYPLCFYKHALSRNKQ